MLVAVVGMYEAGRIVDVVAAVEPDIHRAPAHARRELALGIAGYVAMILFEGALLEHGAILEDSLGESCRVFRLGGETVRAGSIAQEAIKSDVAKLELLRWSSLLATRAPAATPSAPSQFASGSQSSVV